MGDYLTHVYPLVRRKDSPEPELSTDVEVTSSCATNYHDTTHSPLGLWQFSGSLLDSSGNGNTLNVTEGTARYTQAGGLRGFFFDSNTRLTVTSGTGNFYQLGDITIEAIVSPATSHGTVPNIGYFVNFGASVASDALANNIIYSFGIANTANRLTWLHEHSTGVDDLLLASASLMIGNVAHVAAIRQSNVVRFLLNGSRIGTTSSLTAPSDGTSGTLSIGGGAGASSFYTGFITSLKIIGSALTDAEVKAEFDRTLGGRYTIRNTSSLP